MYPKKKEKYYSPQEEYENVIHNQCHDQFTKEIFKRTELEKLAKIVLKAETGRKWQSANEEEKEYWKETVKPLQQHLREGLKEER